MCVCVCVCGVPSAECCVILPFSYLIRTVA